MRCSKNIRLLCLTLYGHIGRRSIVCDKCKSAFTGLIIKRSALFSEKVYLRGLCWVTWKFKVRTELTVWEDRVGYELFGCAVLVLGLQHVLERTRRLAGVNK